MPAADAEEVDEADNYSDAANAPDNATNNGAGVRYWFGRRGTGMGWGVGWSGACVCMCRGGEYCFENGLCELNAKLLQYFKWRRELTE